MVFYTGCENNGVCRNKKQENQLIFSMAASISIKDMRSGNLCEVNPLTRISLYKRINTIADRIVIGVRIEKLF